MKISCQCVTYGRVDLLEESIACFLNQTYSDRELIILNTFPDQTLIFDHPQVKITNLAERPRSLGEARNMCVNLCTGEWITCWDDDNFFLPRQLEMFKSAVVSDHLMWARLDKMFYAEQYQISEIVSGEANLFMFNRKAFDATDGYPSKTCGEDRSLNNEIRAAFPGEIINPKDEDITHVYSWGNDVFHASGKGDEGESTAHQDMEADIRKKIRDKLIPTGEILLKPEIKHDIEEQCIRFVDRRKKENE